MTKILIPKNINSIKLNINHDNCAMVKNAIKQSNDNKSEAGFVDVDNLVYCDMKRAKQGNSED